MITPRIERLLTAIQAWAGVTSDIRAVALVGSYARGTATPESDLDLVILSTNPTPYIDHPTWIEQLGAFGAVQYEDYGRLISLRAREGSCEVEFGISDPSWAALPLDPGTAKVIGDGMRILYDPDGLLAAAIQACRFP
ncbi:MAG TPA: nucleotidyltransferase domain-containing protein [Aggregatilineales bacterium]|nr:nucleotidyltransferase domain-containing protein [Anaerolineales bacterium]HRE47886.1 nucleotidyltransferase domain-containing protein [Aggregatilineales bacterium]